MIVITDSDLDGASISVTVPGAAWMLFYDNIAQGLIDHLHGKKHTKVFLVDY